MRWKWAPNDARTDVPKCAGYEQKKKNCVMDGIDDSIDSSKLFTLIDLILFMES
jgi:hypothetical protein